MKDDILYLEADEEITAAIDKLLHLPGASIKIVVPKRSTLLQSVVNLKLLKKAAEDAGKNLVLVTGDRTSTHLASRLGLAVAATLTSKAEVPAMASAPEPEASDEIEAEDEPESEVEPDPDTNTAPAVAVPASGNKPSYAKPMIVRKPVGDPDQPVSTPVAKSEAKMPDFNNLPKRLLLGAGVIVGVILLLIINYFIKGATVTLFAQGAKIAANFDATLDPTIKTSDPVKAILAADDLTSSHDLTATANATGKQDIGTKAGGTVTIKNCEDTSAHDLPAGTVMSAQGKNFVTNTAVSIPGGSFSNGGKICSTAQSATATVIAAQSGDTYNLAPASYTSGALTSNFIVQGSQMTGGVSKTVNVVTQADIDKAVADLLAKDKDSSQKDLENKVSASQRAFVESFTQTPGAVSANPAVGTQADQTVVNVKVSYSELAVSKSDIQNLLKVQELKQVGSGNQIYDDGVGSLKVTLLKNNPGAASTFNFSTTAYGGAKLDPTEISKSLAGKRYGDAADVAGKLPGVARVDIKLSPFWSTKLPRIASHIKIVIKVASGG